MSVTKYLTFTFLLLLPASSYSFQEQANQRLWHGILSSNSKLVRNALHEGADLSSRFGPYKDTPLMAAIRIYYNELTSDTRKRTKGSLQTTMALCASVATGVLLGHVFKNNATMRPLTESLLYTDSILTQLISIAVFMGIDNAPIGFVQPSALIIELLINQTSQQEFFLRNQEGLTALEILNAYHSVAYQQRDEAWHIFSYLLHKKNPHGY